MTTDTTLWLRNFDEIEGADLPRVGSKAYRLSMLKQHGMNVPPGLVLTADFFEAHLRHFRLIPLWAGSPDVEVTTDSLTWLADTLKTKPLAKELSRALSEQVQRLFPPEIDSFAVRSSAIDEDQHDHTFAGVHLTELGVPRILLPVSISRCWASALSDAATKYRLMHGMSIQGIRIAVIIQQMLHPFSSGVGFTINPLSGSRDEFIIEASWGLGEAVVRGDVRPYSYTLANRPPDYPLLEQQAGSMEPPPEALAQGKNDPLSPDDLTELVRQLEQIQALMGEPQDVEWAKQGDKIHLLQSRPVAVAVQKEPAVDQEWTRGNHLEFLPELPSPLFRSIFEQGQACATPFFESLNLDFKPLGPYIKFILGRPYLNLSMFKKIISQLGINPSTVSYTIGHTENGLATENKLSVDWETAWQKRATYWAIFRRVQQSASDLQTYQKLVEQLTANLDSANTATSIMDLQIELRLHEKLYSEFFKVNLGISIGISTLTAVSSRLIASLTDNPAAAISTLALQDVETVDSKLKQALLKLTAESYHDEVVKNYFAHAPADFADYAPQLAYTKFGHGFANLLMEYRQRGTYEADPAWPRYVDVPTLLLLTVQKHLQSDHPPHETASGKIVFGNELATWNEVVNPKRLFDRLFPLRRILVRPLISYLRQLLYLRDQLNDARAKAMTACRHWDLQLGQQWAQREWLPQAEDIFWLTIDEIERTLLTENNIGITLSSIIQARKETYQGYAELNVPFSLWESQIPAVQFGLNSIDEANADVIVGLPISPGQTQGTVLVLNNPSDFRKIADNIILVAPSTNPAWLPLLDLVSGLIVEMGGLLSHGSVIAREYGLPAVANIPQATKRFHTGDTVLVDGSTGVVQILSSKKQ